MKVEDWMEVYRMYCQVQRGEAERLDHVFPGNEKVVVTKSKGNTCAVVRVDVLQGLNKRKEAPYHV